MRCNMKKIRNLSESDFLKLFFAFYTLCFLVAALLMPDRSQMFTGLLKIISTPGKASTSCFAIGGYSATFLNMGLVGVICLSLFVGLKATANNASTLAFILTVGFGSWGIHILNVWPTFAGVASSHDKIITFVIVNCL